MKFVIICLVLLYASFPAFADICVVKRDAHGKIARSQSELRKFRKLNPCPNPEGAGTICPGYVIDHITPLCACGEDKASNMQWQDLNSSKLKDVKEKQLCASFKANK